MLPLLLLALASADSTPVAAVQDAPVRITLNNDRRFLRGDRAKVKVEVENDGYLLVLHADPDGNLRVLFPLDPADDNFVRGDRTYEIRGRGDREAFTIDVSSGVGAIFASVSPTPFRFSEFVYNDHWDYRALSERELPENPEPELRDLATRMASGGRLEYDYLTYTVYRRDDVAYGGGSTVVYRRSYYDPFCGSSYYFRYDCDPYYYGPRSTVYISFGGPFRYAHYDPYYYDPFYYGRFYDPYYYGSRYYDPYPYRYYGRPVGVYPYRPYSPYRPRFLAPGDFKQATRTWGGESYRDRVGSNKVQATHTVYGEPPVRRTTISDDGRSPVTPSVSRDIGDRPTRREAEKEKDSRNGVVGARPEPSKRAKSEETPTIERRSIDSDRSVESSPTRRGIREERGEPELRRRGSSSEPVIERRSSEERRRSDDRPTIEHRNSEDSRSSDDRPAIERRSREDRPKVERSEEPRRTYSAPERRERSEPRAEPRHDPSPSRAAPSYDPPSGGRSPSPQSAPSGGSSGGGRRHT